MQNNFDLKNKSILVYMKLLGFHGKPLRNLKIGVYSQKYPYLIINAS